MPEPYENEEKRAKILDKVRKLLAKADGNTTPEEADALRAKADQLMAEYAIASFEVVPHKDTGTRPQPVSRPVDFTWYWAHPQGEYLWALMQNLARHVRCKPVYWKIQGEGGGLNMRTGEETPRTYTMPVVGLPADLDYFDMLFTHLMVQISKGIEPHPDPKKPMIENLVTMKEAGMKWQRIADLLAQAGQLPQHTVGGPVKNLDLAGKYTRYCNETGRKRLRVTPSVYQRSFVSEFVYRIGERFREQKRLQERPPSPGEMGLGTHSAALALVDIAKVVDAKVDELFGSPPKSRGRGRKDTRKYDAGAAAAGREAGSRADLSGAKPRTGVSGSKGELNR